MQKQFIQFKLIPPSSHQPEQSTDLKANGYTGESTTIFNSASLLNEVQLLKDRICSPRSKFYSFRVDPLLEGVCLLGKEAVKKVVSLSKNWWDNKVYPYTLRVCHKLEDRSTCMQASPSIFCNHMLYVPYAQATQKVCTVVFLQYDS